MIPKYERFLAETGGWYLCDIELPLQIFNSIFFVDVCLYVFSTWFLCYSTLFYLDRHSDGLKN